jgi:hypothetical protein
MSITWGAWRYSGGNGMRVGIDVTVTTPSNSSSSVTFTAKVYTQNQYSYSDSQTLTYGGNISGTTNYTNSSGSSQTLRATKTDSYTYSGGSYGSSPGSETFTATVSGAYNGVTPSVSVSKAIPARPYATPDEQTSVVATRNSDSQDTLTWTRHATTGAPYTSQTVQMKIVAIGGGVAIGDWVTVGSLSGTAASFVKTGQSSNRVYQYRIRANNTTGSSSYTNSNAVYHTPAPPSNVVSKLLSAGTSISTSWTDNGYHFTTPSTWTIQRSVAGGAYANVVTGLSQATLTWVDPSPGVGTNQYRVAAVNSSLTSAFTTGNVVTTVAAPLAPTNLVPNGTSVDLDNTDVVLTWKHNPGGDGAAQSHFTIETSIDSGSSWQALAGATDVSSTVSSFTIPAGTLVNGVPYLWRVRTEGVVSAGYGPNSASATFTGSTTPTVTLTSPPPVTNSYPIVAAWIYNQDEGSPQASWEADLFQDDGSSLIEQQTGSGTTSTVNFAFVAVSGSSYVVKVRARSGAGIWSEYAVATTSFVLLPPADATITGTYQDCFGTILLHLEPGVPEDGVTVDTASVTIERRVDGGEWVTLGQGILLPTDFLDIIPSTHGLNEYRATALSTLPSLSVGPIVPVQGGDGQAPGDPLWAWVTYGDNFEFSLRVRGDLQVGETSGRQKVAQHFLGRPKPVALVGEATDRTVSVSGSLLFDVYCLDPANASDCIYDTMPSVWTQAGLVSEVVCYRDFTGRRMFGTLSDVVITDNIWPGKASVGFSVTEIDFTERYVQFVTEESA